MLCPLFCRLSEKVFYPNSNPIIRGGWVQPVRGLREVRVALWTAGQGRGSWSCVSACNALISVYQDERRRPGIAGPPLCATEKWTAWGSLGPIAPAKAYKQDIRKRLMLGSSELTRLALRDSLEAPWWVLMMDGSACHRGLWRQPSVPKKQASAKAEALSLQRRAPATALYPGGLSPSQHIHTLDTQTVLNGFTVFFYLKKKSYCIFNPNPNLPIHVFSHNK